MTSKGSMDCIGDTGIGNMASIGDMSPTNTGQIGYFGGSVYYPTSIPDMSPIPALLTCIGARSVSVPANRVGRFRRLAR